MTAWIADNVNLVHSHSSLWSTHSPISTTLVIIICTVWIDVLCVCVCACVRACMRVSCVQCTFVLSVEVCMMCMHMSPSMYAGGSCNIDDVHHRSAHSVRGDWTDLQWPQEPQCAVRGAGTAQLRTRSHRGHVHSTLHSIFKATNAYVCIGWYWYIVCMYMHMHI